MSTVTQTLPTTGGGLVDITGTNLGLAASTISLAYYGGSSGRPVRAYSVSTGCTVVVPGTRIQCPSVAGIGANYTYVPRCMCVWTHRNCCSSFFLCVDAPWTWGAHCVQSLSRCFAFACLWLLLPRFVVTVAGGSSPNSTAMLSYSPPFISSVDGPGALLGPAAGGAVIYLHGVRPATPASIFAPVWVLVCT